MKIAQVVGKISLVKAHPSLIGRRWVLACPQTLEALAGKKPSGEEEIIVVDEMGTTEGAWIGISDGREAAAPFEPERKPVDAYVACILDHWTISQEEAGKLLASSKGK